MANRIKDRVHLGHRSPARVARACPGLFPQAAAAEDGNVNARSSTTPDRRREKRRFRRSMSRFVVVAAARAQKGNYDPARSSLTKCVR
jgi:hypothetical protein